MKVTQQQMASNLSVVSAPAPVIQRPDIVPHNHALQRQPVNSAQAEVRLRSTNSQRARGAANNLRVKQLEMRETQAGVVFT